MASLRKGAKESDDRHQYASKTKGAASKTRASGPEDLEDEQQEEEEDEGVKLLRMLISLSHLLSGS